MQLNKYLLKKTLFVAVLSISILNSCRVTLVPNFDAGIAAQIDNTSKTVDKFYLTMLETTTTQNGGRAFNKYVEQYVDIEVELNSLLSKNKVRPLNKNSTRICEITVELWRKYKEEHKKIDSLSDGLIIINQKYFSDLFYAMQVAEDGKAMINSYQNQNKTKTKTP